MQNIDEILKLADECLNCKNPLCRQGCPVSTNIPGFISKVKEKDFESAYYILQENNIMSNICSKICPTEKQCMGKCIKGIKGEPVKINILENFVNEWAQENNIQYKVDYKRKNNIKVAVIGAGPAGISCSIELSKKGFNVTLFEKEHDIGGVLRYGIPDFRLSKDFVHGLRSKLEDANVQIKTNMEFGKDITEKTLNKQGYRAVFLGIGASKSSIYKLSKDKSEKTYKADEFLKMYNSKETREQENLGIVAVIGGGNVAFDAARASIRRGAEKVYILYRRDLKSMPARKEELQIAIDEGIEIMYQTKVISASYIGEMLNEITCIRTRMEDEKPIDITGSQFTMKVDNIIFAIGIFPDKELLESQGIKFDRALIEVDENQMTNIPGLFAGGDLIEARSSVCRAINMGKNAAENIENYIKNN